MKKALIFSALVLALASCGNSGTEASGDTDTLGDNPSAITDETKHPTGVTNQNVISTDTAAMNVERMSDTTGNR